MGSGRQDFHTLAETDSYRGGALWDGHGTKFTVSSRSAAAMDLCLLDPAGQTERRLAMERAEDCWHVRAEGVGPGQVYGFRAHGRWDPRSGMFFNPERLLIDPYARAIASGVADGGPMSVVVAPARSQSSPPLSADSGAQAPTRVLPDSGLPRLGTALRRLLHPTPWADTVIYELHVKGFTAAHPDVPAALRGTYAGLAHPAVLEYLSTLGVTAVELLPVHHFVPEPALAPRGLTNYWGYCSIGYFAPHGPYSSAGDLGAQVQEFADMVSALHSVGLEVIVDVVYNHTAEGPADGRTLSFRGLDNAAYYRLDPHDAGRYQDLTGTGNTLDAGRPAGLRLIMDSLRYWVTEMGVDGFRFDLASALARGSGMFDPNAAFLLAVAQDPVLASVKLVAEPWDATSEGYQLGRFPPGWSEWNDRYRDAVRDYWRGQSPSPAEMGFRLTGSADLFAAAGRPPRASVNFVTAHDGFTLRDVVSYDRKHNRSNGEDGRDGVDHNRSWNCGAEGDTADPIVLACRRRQVRNFLVTLMVSQGVPMITAGDEMGRTQRGNNNAYCHDSPLGWLDWEPGEEGEELIAFTRELLALRRTRRVLRRKDYLGEADITWFDTRGTPMTPEMWSTPGSVPLGMVFQPVGGPGGDGLLVFMNPQAEPVMMVPPRSGGPGPAPDLRFDERGGGEPKADPDRYPVLVDTSGRHLGRLLVSGLSYPVDARSALVCGV
ncbi:MAG: glycogen debranching protein GlgX [Acidimicrobiales bacterium]